MRRELLQLADHYDPKKHNVATWFISEKMDGMRCFWDGGLSRGLPTVDVPWASIIDPKTGKRKTKIKPVASGLWSRYGNPIMAPDWFLNSLPCCLLDGELWCDRGKFQLCRSICAGDEPDPRFTQISYAVYSSPPLAAVFATGEIKNANTVRAIDFIAIEHWVKNRLEKFDGDFRYLPPGTPFVDELRFLNEHLDNLDPDSRCYLHQQIQLPANTAEARLHVEVYLQKVLDQGGEGVVIRDSLATWQPKRHKGILKWKPFLDTEATVVGFTTGRATDKGSRLLGKIGALIVNYQGKRLELAGLTDEEREFGNVRMQAWAVLHPGLDVPPDVGVQSRHFKKGQTVTFKFRELTDDGVPKEARYWRRRDVE